MKIICIYDYSVYAERSQELGETYPILNGVYSIRQIRQIQPNLFSYLLNEIVNPERLYLEMFGEVGFWAHHFRPITDISELEKLTKIRELEDA